MHTELKAPWLERDDPQIESPILESYEPGESVLGSRFLKNLVGDREILIEPESGMARLQTKDAKVSLSGAILGDLVDYIEEGAEVLSAKLLTGLGAFRFDALPFRIANLRIETEKHDHWTEYLDERLQKNRRRLRAARRPLRRAAARAHQRLKRLPGGHMPILIEKPTIIEAAGNKPKIIREFFGAVNSRPQRAFDRPHEKPGRLGRAGPDPEFDEFTVVLEGTLLVEHRSGVLKVQAGQAVLTTAGEWVRYSTPDDVGAEYIADLPAGLLAAAPSTATRPDAGRRGDDRRRPPDPGGRAALQLDVPLRQAGRAALVQHRDRAGALAGHPGAQRAPCCCAPRSRSGASTGACSSCAASSARSPSTASSIR